LSLPVNAATCSPQSAAVSRDLRQMKIHTLHTPRLVLRSLIQSDTPILHSIYQVEGVLRYFPNPVPPLLERVEQFVDGQQAHWEKYGYGNWGIVFSGETKLIGWAGLQFLAETGETEVGYLLGRPFWGKGYAAEAARASLQFGFDHFNFEEIIALVHPDNAASLKVAAKCGLIPVERKTYWGIEMVRHVLKRP
jgi:[ribosomal protein S5]-alanine N-acetyltransferase